MKHTKGTWDLIPFDPHLSDWTGASFVIRNDQHAPGGIAVTIGGVGAEEEANARLIAAAPDLLKALKEAEIALVNCIPVVPYPGDGPLVKIRAVIAKAEGSDASE